jgi:hypothetical protein
MHRAQASHNVQITELNGGADSGTPRSHSRPTIYFVGPDVHKRKINSCAKDNRALLGARGFQPKIFPSSRKRVESHSEP